jgi:hypothetical protein
MDHERSLAYILFGYFGGPLVLDSVISGFSARPIPTTSMEITRWFDNTLQQSLRIRSTVAARLFQINRYNVMRLFEMHTGLVQAMEAVRGGEKGSPDMLAKIVESMYEETPWHSSMNVNVDRNSAEIYFASTAQEPRASERLLIGQGSVPDHLADLPATFTNPRKDKDHESDKVSG